MNGIMKTTSNKKDIDNSMLKASKIIKKDKKNESKITVERFDDVKRSFTP